MNMIVDQDMPFWHEQEKAWVVRETENWIVAVSPMLVNDRITICTKEEWGRTYTAGFCYDKGGLAMVAALAWNIDEDQYPPFTKKIAYDARHESDTDLSHRQWICRWCLGDLERDGVVMEFESHADDQRLCAQCGSLREGAIFSMSPRNRQRLRFPARWPAF